MKDVKFLPFVGDNYNKGLQGKKVLVLGESHYCANASEAVPSLTQDIIKDLYDPNSEFEPYKNTYTKFAKSLVNKDLTVKDKEEIWNKLAFYNFVQNPITGPRKPPSNQEFLDSHTAFFQVLEALQPDCILAWGSRLYDNLPDKGNQGENLTVVGDTPIETWNYTLSNGKVVKVMAVTHPSSGYSWDWWYQRITQFLYK